MSNKDDKADVFIVGKTPDGMLAACKESADNAVIFLEKLVESMKEGYPPLQTDIKTASLLLQKVRSDHDRIYHTASVLAPEIVNPAEVWPASDYLECIEEGECLQDLDQYKKELRTSLTRFLYVESKEEIYTLALLPSQDRLRDVISRISDILQTDDGEFERRLRPPRYFMRILDQTDTDPSARELLFDLVEGYLGSTVRRGLEEGAYFAPSGEEAYEREKKRKFDEVVQDFAQKGKAMVNIGEYLTKEDMEEAGRLAQWVRIGIPDRSHFIYSTDPGLLSTNRKNRGSVYQRGIGYLNQIFFDDQVRNVQCLLEVCHTGILSEEAMDYIYSEYGGFGNTIGRLYLQGYLEQRILRGYGTFYVLSQDGLWLFKQPEFRLLLRSCVMNQVSDEDLTPVPAPKTPNEAMCAVCMLDFIPKLRKSSVHKDFHQWICGMTIGVFLATVPSGKDGTAISFLGIVADELGPFYRYHTMIKQETNEFGDLLIVIEPSLTAAKAIGEWTKEILEVDIPVLYSVCGKEEIYDAATGEKVSSSRIRELLQMKAKSLSKTDVKESKP